MSISNLFVPNNYDLYCNDLIAESVNGLSADTIALPSVQVGNAAGTATTYPVSGYLYGGSSIVGIPTKVRFYYFPVSGTLGTMTVRLVDTIANVYYSAALDIAVSFLDLAVGVALPASKTALKLEVTVDTTSDKKILPIALEITF